jgi:hypothetical protein
MVGRPSVEACGHDVADCVANSSGAVGALQACMHLRPHASVSCTVGATGDRPHHYMAASPSQKAP